MSKKMSGVLIAYGIVVALSGVLLRKTALETAASMLPVGIAVGALCVIWGVRGFLGRKRRVEAIMTVIAATIAMLIQVVPSCLTALSDKSAGPGAGFLAVLFLITFGMLLYLVHGERLPEFYNQTRSGRH